ncbi:tetraspanin-18 [Dermatophagoides farinae]|nr:leukocyte surface antigen CD53-like [Dermatophagoides farinae]
MYSPAPPQSTTSSPLSPPENQSSTPKIDIAATTSVPPPPTNTNPNAERVYVWDCCRSFCVSNNRLMNRIITWAIIFFNVLLFMMSATILGIGIWLIADPKSYEPSRFLDTYNVIWAAYIMIIISSFTLALSIFGILAVQWENIYMIILYLIFLLICFGMQVAIVTLAIMRGYGTRLYIFAYKELLRELQQYNYQAESRAFIDFFQIKLRCCGVESFNDYPRYGMAIPISCYMAGKTYLNEQGCALALRRHYELRTAVVGFLCFFNGWIHLIIAILIFFLLFCRKY